MAFSSASRAAPQDLSMRPSSQIDAVFLESLTVLLGAGVVHLRPAANFLDGLLERLARGAAGLEYAAQFTDRCCISREPDGSPRRRRRPPSTRRELPRWPSRAPRARRRRT